MISLSKNVFSLLKAIFTSVLLILFGILFFILCIPICVYRLLVIVSSKLRPSLVQPLSFQSSIMATDAIYSNPECSYVIQMVLENGVSKEVLESRLEEATLHPNYKQLTYSLNNWMGFYFWKKPFAFKLANHVKYVDKSVDIEDLSELHSSLVNQPFERNKPLWECIVYKNVNAKSSTDLQDASGSRRTVLFFRVHQTLADGSSFLRIFEELKLNHEHEFLFKLMAGSGGKKPSDFKAKLQLAKKVLLLGPYQIIGEWIDRKISGSTPAPGDNAKFSKFVTKELNLENAKRIALRSFTPPTGLVLSLICGVAQKLESKDNDEQNKAETVRLNVTLPLPWESKGLNNHVAQIPLDSPIDDKNPLQRITGLMNLGSEMMNSPKFYTFMAATFLVGALPSVMITFFARRLPWGTVVVNNFPGALAKKTFLGGELSAIRIKSGRPSVLGDASCVVNCVVYGGEVWVSMGYPEELELPGKLEEEYKRCQSGQGGSSFGAALNGLMNIANRNIIA